MNDIKKRFIIKQDGQNFEILSCMQVADYVKDGKGVLQEAGIQDALIPLLYEGCDIDFIVDTADKSMKFFESLLKKPNGGSKKNFTYNKIHKYSILCYKLEPWIYGFLTKALSEKEAQTIEKEAVKIPYFMDEVANALKKSNKILIKHIKEILPFNDIL